MRVQKCADASDAVGVAFAEVCACACLRSVSLVSQRVGLAATAFEPQRSTTDKRVNYAQAPKQIQQLVNYIGLVKAKLKHIFYLFLYKELIQKCIEAGFAGGQWPGGSSP